MTAAQAAIAPVIAFGAPGFWEWIFLAVLGLLIFGPERLPKMAQSAGEMIAKFKREAAGTLDELKAAAELDDFTDVARDLRSTTADLRSSFDLRSSPTKPRTAVMASSGGDDIAPAFDPDMP